MMDDRELSVNALSFHVPDRMLDDGSLYFELNKIIENIRKEETYTSGQRNAITLSKTQNMRIVLVALHTQSEINFNHSSGVMSIQLIEGKINYKADEKSGILLPCSLLVIHEKVKHTLTAIEESVILMTIAQGDI